MDHASDPGQTETYLSFDRQMAKALDGEGQVAVPAEDARDVIRLIEMIMLSSEKGMTLRVSEQWEVWINEKLTATGNL